MFPRVTHPSATPPCEGVRLACVKPAASVRSEPGSNSQVVAQELIPTSHSLCPSSDGQSRRVPNTSAQAQRNKPQRPKRDEFGNVTSSVISRRTEVQCLPLGKPQGYRRPRFSFFRCNCQTARKLQSSPKQPVQPKPDQGNDDNTPGKPCQDIYLRANPEAVKTRSALSKQRRRR